jgi:cytochrome bd ubiquinol oxidase subunit I
MHFDVELLARIQFAFTVMFHYLYPPLSIGLGMILVFMEALYLWTKNPQYEAMCKFWVKVFALNFSLGVATGIVMQVEFGTNWATYSRYVGDIFGSALAAEGIFAFFLESGFLAVLLFGWNRVSPKVHFFSTVMVCLGATFSAFWITVANSWMHTPAGYEIVGEGLTARAIVTDFWAMVFNPSAMLRFMHSVVGGWICGAFFVMSISAYYILKNRHLEFARRSFLIALVFAAVSVPLQAFLGHKQGEVVAKYQPAKLAAYEGHFETGGNAPVYIIGLPDAEEKRVKYGIKIPGLLSFLVTGKFDGEVKGLNDIPADQQPPVVVPFLAYHGMIAIGLYLLALSWLGLFLAWRGKLFRQRWLLRVFVISVIAPYVANQLGWIATEVGRQPWVIQGILRTSDALSKSVGAHAVLASLILFTLVYALLFLVFLYSLDRKIKHGPEEPEDHLSGKTKLGNLVDVAGKRADPASRSDEEE